MAKRSVVLSGVPYAVEFLRQLQLVGNFDGGESLVYVVECLVVDELIDGSGVFEVVADDVGTPMRPVVTLEDDVGAVGKLLYGLEDVVAPSLGVAYLCATQGVEVMERAGTVFGHP